MEAPKGGERERGEGISNAAVTHIQRLRKWRCGGVRANQKTGGEECHIRVDPVFPTFCRMKGEEDDSPTREHFEAHLSISDLVFDRIVSIYMSVGRIIHPILT